MIKHIVWWTLKDEAEGRPALENGRRMIEMLEGLSGQIESLNSLEISLAVEESTTVEAHLVLQTSHENMEGLSAYANHPKHLEVVDFIKKVVSSRQAIDYAI